MKFLAYFIIFSAVLFLSYRISLLRAYIFSILVSIFILIRGLKIASCETLIYLLFVNTVPIVTERFKGDFDRQKDVMRANLEEVKKTYEGLSRKDKQEIQSNLEIEKRLHQVLSLYEISKDMSTCLMFEDIFTIFSSTLKKSFRFKVSKLVLLKEPKDIEAVYQIEFGHRINKLAPDGFDRELVNIVLESEKIISISPEEVSQYLRRLSVVKDFETLIAIPLFAEKNLAGILYIENIPRMHFENFIILASQFAIQFQKVILYKKVQEMSITDFLTEVSTRRCFLERFSEEIRRSMRHKSNLSFLMLDLDHFKEKNDRFGHLVGDVVLKEIASILKANLREVDIIGRYGGEEFAIVLAGTGRDEAFKVAERIRESIGGAVLKAYDEIVSTTVSVGISTFPDDGVDMEALIESADRALYKAKESGRNRVC